MPYGTSALRGHAQAGDPFLGGVIKGALGVAGTLLPGPLGGAARAAKGVLYPSRRPSAQRQIAAMPGGRPGRPSFRSIGHLPPAPLPGGGFIPTPIPGRTLTGQKKRRRMNYQNQKAARRSIRRLTGMARQNKALRKAASEFAREFGPKRSAPRRDLGRGHTHVR